MDSLQKTPGEFVFNTHQSRKLGQLIRLIRNASASRTTGLLAFLLIFAAIPLTVYIAQKQQEIRQRATAGQVTCSLSAPAEAVISDAFEVTLTTSRALEDTESAVLNYGTSANNTVWGPAQRSAGQTTFTQYPTYGTPGWYYLTGSVDVNGASICQGDLSTRQKAVQIVAQRTSPPAATATTAPPAATNTPVPATSTPASEPINACGRTCNRMRDASGVDYGTQTPAQICNRLPNSSALAANISGPDASGACTIVCTYCTANNTGSTTSYPDRCGCIPPPTLTPIPTGSGARPDNRPTVPAVPPTASVSQPAATAQPTATSAPATATLPPTGTVLAMSITLQGIGNAGNNTNPRNPRKDIVVSLFNASGQKITERTGRVDYQEATGLFTGSIDMGAVSTAAYTVKLKIKGYLTKQAPGIFPIIAGRNTYTTQGVRLTAGDANNDNRIDIADWTIVSRDCFTGRSTSACDTSRLSPDTNDDGKVDLVDISTITRNLGSRQE